MKLFTTVAVATLGFASLFVPAANARDFNDDDCTYRNGTVYCIINNGGGNWELGISDRRTSETEYFEIQCLGDRVVDWRSYGDFSQSKAEAVAEAWCAA